MVRANDDEPLILSHWHEWEIHGSDRRVILCVETPLELQPDRDGFDRRRLDALVHEAANLMRSSASPIDRIRIVQSKE